VLAENLEDSQPRLHPDAAIIFSSGGLAEIKQRLGHGGKLFVESSVWSFSDKEGYKSAKDASLRGIYLIPAVEKSYELGSGQVANIIFLGAYLTATGALPLEKVEAALEKKMAGGKRASLRELNKRALRLGASLVHQMLSS
jgi:2-oxoglutarate ferredoxin oxidoreductase subunit gamma